MHHYCIAGQDFRFYDFFPELEPFVMDDKVTRKDTIDSFLRPTNGHTESITRVSGWVGGAQRLVEVHDSFGGILLKIEGCGEFLIAPHGETISKLDSQEGFSQLDREIILGPAIVLALALRGVWSLHASAAMCKGNVIVFLGESGQGKSTLVAYLSQCAGWRLVADDILPVGMDAEGINILPRFPQLKMPVNAQPGVVLPERLPLKCVCILTHAESSQMPELRKVETSQSIQALLGHIAGTRMFNALLLAKHLEFSTQAAERISAYRLIHPHRRDTLPLVREFLESIC